MFKSNYPDYKRISEIVNELQNIHAKQDSARYWDDEAYAKERQLNEALKRLVMGEPVQSDGRFCNFQGCGCGNFDRDRYPVYYPGKVHHLDGDADNDSFNNLAMVCPKCQAHILLSRFGSQDIFLLKTGGVSNAEIGRLLGISRERVRQLYKEYETKHAAELAAILETSPDDLVKKAEFIENHLIASGRLKRRIDRRTKKKRIINELDKLKAQQTGTHTAQGVDKPKKA